MKKSLRLLAAIFSFFAFTATSNASHIAGGNITYLQTGPNEYLIQACFYRDVSGIGMPPSIVIQANSSCGSVNVNIPLTAPGTLIPPSICGTTTNFEEYCYYGTITLPTACVDWVLSWSTCCRNDLINNLVNPQNQSNFNFATLNSIAAPNNSSPQFAYDPIQVFCVGNEYYFDWGISDPDGDSLAFSLVAPKGTGINNDLNFVAPYTAQCPFPTTPPCAIYINPHTGVLNFTPAQVGWFAFAMLVEEFDVNGVLIGSVIRDIQIEVQAPGSCPNFSPGPDTTVAYDPNDPTKGIYLTCGDTAFVFPIDTSASFLQCGSVAIDGSDFRITGPLGNPSVVPVTAAYPINCNAGITGDIFVNFFQPLVNGTYEVRIKVGNDGNTLIGECGFAIADDTLMLLLIVDDNIRLLADTVQVNCNAVTANLSYTEGFDCSTLAGDASDFILTDDNGTPYPISSIVSTDCSTQDYGYDLTVNFSLGGNIPAVLYLTVQTGSDNNTLANRCGNFSDVGDTVGVIFVGGNIPVDLGPDIILCDYDPLPLLDPGVFAANYEWTLDGIPISTDPTLQTTGPGIYSLVVSDGLTCGGGDTLQIWITPSPQIDLGPDITYCAGDIVQDLDATFTGANTYEWTLNGSFFSNQPIITPSATGTYIVEINAGAQCLGYDTVYVAFVQQLSLTVTGLDTICDNESTILDVSVPGSTIDTYSWLHNGDPVGGNTSTISINQGGLYTVVATTVTGCTGTQDFEVVAASTPLAPTASCASVTDGFYTYQWAPVPDVVGYLVSVDGGNTWIVPSSGTMGTEHQTNVATNNFMVQALNNTRCSPGPGSDPVACEIEIPNIITPAEADGKNDVFVIKNLIQYPDNNLKIFNRWGNLIYDKDRYGMDGYWWNGGASLPGGVYFYVINLNDGNEPRRGTLTVVK